MATSPPPWLADLDDDWATTDTPSTRSRPHFTSLTPGLENMSMRRTQSDFSRQASASPNVLSEIVNRDSHINARSSIRQNGSAKSTHRSNNSARSVVQQDTMARRAKSSSPTKKALTLEWQRRIIDGDVGYGDQTDLFGPSGLENMFATPTKSSPPNRQKTANSPFARFKPVTQMPSSPPVWTEPKQTFDAPSNLATARTFGDDGSEHSAAAESTTPNASQASLRSDDRKTSGFEAPTTTNRTVSGQTDLGNEDFSPVFISKHTTWKGDVDYAPMTRDMARLINSTASRHDNQHDFPRQEADIDDDHTAPEVSLPDNLPTGTPPVARLGTFVNIQRGGLSEQGSFRHHPLSPSSHRPVSISIQESLGHTRAQSDPSAAVGTASRGTPGPKATSSPIAAQSPQHLSPRPPTSPLKLFGAHDTFTNRKLLRRISELEFVRENSVRSVRPSSASVEQASAAMLHKFREPEPSTPGVRKTADRQCSFGEGILDHYGFPAEPSFDDARKSSQRDEVDFEGSPPADVVPPGALTPAGWQVPESSHLSAEKYGTKRKLSQRSTAKSRGGQVEFKSEHEIVPPTGSICVKRLRESPCKARTPKRRRTLHQQDLEQLALSDDASQIHHDRETTPPIVGHELNSSELPVHSPATQRRHAVQSEIADATAEFVSDPPRLQALQEQLEASALLGSEHQAAEARNIASKVAAFTINSSKSPNDGLRKRSITTQDFLDEAMQIMAVIRARVGPQNGLASVEETEEDRQTSICAIRDEYDHEQPQAWSAPESRTGTIDGWRPRGYLQQDPRVVSQLRRFAEKDEQDVLDATLPANLSLVEDPIEAEESILDTAQASDIRITGPRYHSRRFSTASHDGRIETVDSNFYADDYPTGKTTDSNGSRRSDNVATLAPETVAHLIPAEVAGMIFDPTQKKWIRIKRARSASRAESYSRAQSVVASDDDPFGNIPDLTVDEMRELERAGLQAATTTGRAATVHTTGPSGLRNVEPADFSSSTNPTKMSAFASSAPQPETRATSWGTQQYGKSTRAGTSGQHVRNQSHESRVVSSQLEFSPTDANVEDELTEELPTLPEEDEQQSPSPNQHDEMSIVAQLPNKRLFSVSLSVKKPAPVARPFDNTIARYASPRSPNVYLSDLPDFTVNQIDEIRPSEVALAQRVADRAVDSTNNRYALALNDMVKSLTDAEPQEPHWEDIKHLTLSNKSLGTLHGLDEFCERLQALDISNNAITHVEGAPSSTRWLSAASNNLTSLTAWHHLHNLQFLDISNNDMDSLLGLSDLCHLRHLRANGNNLTSLEGVTELDGLVTLEARGNLIAEVDFLGVHMSSLEMLDLSCNNMTSCRNTFSLSALNRLCLDDNKLSSFAFGDSTRTAFSTLRELSTRANHLRTIDVTAAPNLRHVDLSQNRLHALDGLDKLECLDVLLLNGQRQADRQLSIVESVLGQPMHARCVRLSHNTTPTLELPLPQYNVQSLDLSHCGITALPNNFGLQLSNVKLLNLNFNSLQDIRPLANLECTRELHLAGNSISRLRQTTITCGSIAPLRSLDLRDNPFSHTYYPTRGTETSTQLVVPDPPASSDRVPTAKEAKELFRPDLLPPASPERDNEYMARTDKTTKLARRVYEILIASKCSALEDLDGMPLRRKEIARHDEIWRRLVELGMLKKSKGLQADSSGVDRAGVGRCVDAVSG